MLIKFKKAQSTAEYAILFSLVVGAALAMQVYIRRSIQAKMHGASDAFTAVTGDIVGDETMLGTTSQYEPYYKVQESTKVRRMSELNRETETQKGGNILDNSEQEAFVASASVEATHIAVDDEGYRTTPEEPGVYLGLPDYDDPTIP